MQHQRLSKTPGRADCLWSARHAAFVVHHGCNRAKESDYHSACGDPAPTSTLHIHTFFPFPFLLLSPSMRILTAPKDEISLRPLQTDRPEASCYQGILPIRKESKRGISDFGSPARSYLYSDLKRVVVAFGTKDRHSTCLVARSRAVTEAMCHYFSCVLSHPCPQTNGCDVQNPLRSIFLSSLAVRTKLLSRNCP